MKTLKVYDDRIELRHPLSVSFAIDFVLFIALIFLSFYTWSLFPGHVLRYVMLGICIVFGVLSAVAYWDGKQVYVIDKNGIEGRFSWFVKERYTWDQITSVALCRVLYGKGNAKLPAIGFEYLYTHYHTITYSGDPNLEINTYGLRKLIDKLAGKKICKDYGLTINDNYNKNSTIDSLTVICALLAVAVLLFVRFAMD